MARKLDPYGSEHYRFDFQSDRVVTICECGWTYVTPQKTPASAREAARAFAAHAVESHNCTYKKNPVGP